MAREKTYEFENDYPLTASATDAEMAKKWLWTVVALLTGKVGGLTPKWVVTRSSDAATAADSDLWGATFDPAKIVQLVLATETAAHSWIVLHNATLGVWLIIDYWGRAGAVAQKAKFTICFTAPTGGTVNARPTSTQETFTIGSNNSTNDGKFFIGQDTVAHRIHVAMASDGAFFLLTSKNLSGLFTSMLSVWKLEDVHANDGYPVALYLDQHATALCTNVVSRLFTNNNSVANDRPYGMRAASANEIANATADFPFVNCPSTGTGDLLLGQGNSPDPVSGEFITAPIRLWSRPCTAGGFLSTETSPRGRVPDWFITHPGIPHGTLSPQLGPVEYVTVGSTLVPFNQAPTL